ncbi:leucine-rich repeat domain-containing protein [Treponema denticola]
MYLEALPKLTNTAFFECTGITEVHLPESLTKIGTYAFKDCEGMRKLVLGKNLTHIGYGAFADCKNLEGKLEFPSDLAEIGASAFSGCFKLSALDFSECTKPLTIGNYAFQSCEHDRNSSSFLQALPLWTEEQFWNCNNVECFDFYLCSSPPLTAIGSDAFYGTNGRFKVKTGTGIKELLTGSRRTRRQNRRDTLIEWATGNLVIPNRELKET